VNPFELDPTGLMVWGLVAHLVADWPLQNDWMANNKAKRGKPGALSDPLALERQPWWLRHPAAYVHAAIHGVLLALVFGWVAGPLALAHLVIDCRWPVAKWSRFMRQTQPRAPTWATHHGLDPDCGAGVRLTTSGRGGPLVDVGLEVRFWTDQVFHIACIALAALVVGNV
jgi:hypothetical protein